MNLFRKQFFNEKLEFTSEKSAEVLKLQMLKVCDTGMLDMSTALSGLMYDDGYFKFTRKWQVGLLAVNGLSTSISGYVLQDGTGCIVETTLRPVILYPIMALLFFIAGMVVMANSFENGLVAPASLKIGLVCMLVVPGIFGIAGYLKKERLRTLFVETFDLSGE